MAEPPCATPRLVHLLRAGLIGLARFDLFERRLTGKPPHIGEATTLWLGLRFGSTPRKNGSSARGLTMTATADLIRATVHNRIDNQVARASVANHRRRRSNRSRAALPTVVCRGANSRSAQSHRRHFADNASAHRAGLGSATCSRREERSG